MKNNKQFKTEDLILAATLITFGYKLVDLVPNEDKHRPNLFFIFVDELSIKKTVQEFHQGKLTVEPRKFAYEWKTLKYRLHNFKEDVEG